MKIEKGKLYYDTLKQEVFKCSVSQDEYAPATDKIAVHCHNILEFDYVIKKYNPLNLKVNDYDTFKGKTVFCLDSGKIGYFDFCTGTYKVIIFNEFKQLTENNAMSIKNDDNVQNNGHKESSNKLNYELDFDFITQMSERMQTNKGKYEPYNWKKPIDVESLKQALFRHVIEVMKGNYQDDGRLNGHLEAISCNAMMLNYQLKNKK